MTGMTFPTVTEFYVNNNSKDGLHRLYSKKADNFRRRLQATGASPRHDRIKSLCLIIYFKQQYNGINISSKH